MTIRLKKFLILTVLMTAAVAFLSCDQLTQVITGGSGITDAEIANALKQALEFGVEKKVTNLARTGGFYNNRLVRIGYPQQLQVVVDTLKRIGMGSLVDTGVRLMNRAAEVAVKQAIPIFVNAIKKITITDARDILFGPQNAATIYLKRTTYNSLKRSFYPIIKRAFVQVGADQVWRQIISKYNALPFTSKVNPDLADYVTNRALDGVFTMIEQEEREIRTNIRARTTQLLRKVFALQDR